MSKHSNRYTTITHDTDVRGCNELNSATCIVSGVGLNAWIAFQHCNTLSKHTHITCYDNLCVMSNLTSPETNLQVLFDVLRCHLYIFTTRLKDTITMTVAAVCDYTVASISKCTQHTYFHFCLRTSRDGKIQIQCCNVCVYINCTAAELH